MMKTKSRLLLTGCGMLAVVFCGTILVARAAEIDPVNPPKSARVPAKTNGTTSTNASRDVRLSAGLDDIVKLTKAGVDESVILAFIESSAVAYRPSALEILKLRELGISSPVIAVLLRRGEEVRQRAADAQREAAARNAAQPPPAPAVSNPPPQQPTTPPPSVNYTPVVYPATYPTVVYANYPSYSYYPVVSYGYRNCYYPRSYYSYSYFPRSRYYGGYYSHSAFSVGYRGGHYGHYRGGYGGFRHCR